MGARESGDSQLLHMKKGRATFAPLPINRLMWSPEGNLEVRPEFLYVVTNGDQNYMIAYDCPSCNTYLAYFTFLP